MMEGQVVGGGGGGQSHCQSVCVSNLLCVCVCVCMYSQGTQKSISRIDSNVIRVLLASSPMSTAFSLLILRLIGLVRSANSRGRLLRSPTPHGCSVVERLRGISFHHSSLFQTIFFLFALILKKYLILL